MADAREMAVLDGQQGRLRAVARAGRVDRRHRRQPEDGRACAPAFRGALCRALADGPRRRRAGDHDDRSVSRRRTPSKSTPSRDRFRVGGMAKGSGMIEPRMATMLGYLTTDAAGRAGDPAARAGRGVPLHVQRHHRRRRELDQRLRLRAGQRRQRRAASTRSSTRRSSRASAPSRSSLSLGIVRGGEGATKLIAITVSGARVARRGLDGGARHRQLAARQDGRARRRSELGPAGRRRRAVGRDFLARRARRCASARSCCSATASRTTSWRRRPPTTCRARRSRSKSTSAPAAAAARRCTPATCRRSTCKINAEYRT